MLKSYLRHVLATIGAVIIALNGHIFDADGIRAVAAAALVAIIPPLMRWIDPHDEQYGRLVAPDHLDEH